MSPPELEIATLTNLGTVLGPSNEPWQVELNDPAVSVMTDFRVRPLFKVELDDSIDEALHKMKVAGLRIAFIFEKDSEKLLGAITAWDILGDKPVRNLKSLDIDLRGLTRKDLRVKDIMEPVDAWVVVDMLDVERMDVKTVLATLQKCGRTHLPVLEFKDHAKPRLRGLFSSAKILRLTEVARYQAERAAREI